MLSARLIQMIEGHWQPISARFLRQIRSSPELPQLQRLSDSELVDRAENITKNLGRWLLSSEKDISSRYESLGFSRYQEGIPLHEVVRAIQILKENIVGFVRDQGFGGTSVELYAEEELEHLISRFFDSAVYHVVHGYEETMRRAPRSVAV